MAEADRSPDPEPVDFWDREVSTGVHIFLKVWYFATILSLSLLFDWEKVLCFVILTSSVEYFPNKYLAMSFITFWAAYFFLSYTFYATKIELLSQTLTPFSPCQEVLPLMKSANIIQFERM
jgi:hypothetical protein